MTEDGFCSRKEQSAYVAFAEDKAELPRSGSPSDIMIRLEDVHSRRAPCSCIPLPIATERAIELARLSHVSVDINGGFGGFGLAAARGPLQISTGGRAGVGFHWCSS